MKIEKNKTVSFQANIIHKHGIKKKIIGNIEQYWQELNSNQGDMFNEKSYVNKIMGQKDFDAKVFYNKILKNFKKETKDFDFTLILKNDSEKKPPNVVLKTVDDKIYTVAESREYPLWIHGSDFFMKNRLLTKATKLLEYNERDSKLSKDFYKLWSNKIRG